MTIKQNIIDRLVDQKNRMTKELKGPEKKEADMYFEEAVKELGPVLESLERIVTNKEVLDTVSESFKAEIKEQEWLEKLSKTFYHLSGSLQ